jgi:hypothetical protein
VGEAAARLSRINYPEGNLAAGAASACIYKADAVLMARRKKFG